MNVNGFYNASVGPTPDTVNAIALCRADLQLDTCRSCVQNTTVNLIQGCPNRRQATYWAPSCMLRYSDEPIFRTLATYPALYVRYPVNASSPDEFNADLRLLLQNLQGRAARGGSVYKVAAGNRNTTDFQTIYALVQCTPDLTADDCTSCLNSAAQQVRICCDSLTGVRILMPSCNLRYEIQPFYNQSRLLELTAVAAPPPTEPPVMAVPPKPPGKGDNNTARIVIIVVSVSCALIFAIFFGFFLRKRIKQKPNEELDTDEISVVESLHYEFDKVRVATNDFSKANMLGQGGFGAVYRGKLLNGQEIAVKRLSTDSSQGDSEFKNEVMLLAKLQHRNLVRLLGFTMEGTEKLLVYEFLQNTSLDRFIFDPQRSSSLDWHKRYKIVKGIARGLLYLHEDSRLTIIHRDLKAGNILLDDNMNPKIADFGSARLFVQDVNANTRRIVGTFGYMAPEYVMHGQFSVKSDVFSYGVLVLEIVSGQKSNSFQNGGNREDFLTRAVSSEYGNKNVIRTLNWRHKLMKHANLVKNVDPCSQAWRNWQEGTVSNLIDPVLRGSSGIPGDILRCIHIGLLCVQQNAADRPTMASVVVMLNSYSLSLPVPSEPAFVAANDIQEHNISAHSSQNGVSITELDPR